VHRHDLSFEVIASEQSGAKQSPDIKVYKDCFGKRRLAMTSTTHIH